MTRRDHLALLNAPRRVWRHVHRLGVEGESALSTWLGGGSIDSSLYETVCQELNCHEMRDADGFGWWWTSTRRCECGYMAYTAPQGGPLGHRAEAASVSDNPDKV